jgi:cation:H+ antiporter
MTLALQIVGGFVLLFLGAEMLVRGASRLAALLGIPPVVVGLTVVAFGTSAPELAVSLLAARSGDGGISVGNVVGSNIINILLILGIASIIRPLDIHSRVVWRDVPVMLAVSLLALGLAWDGVLGLTDGVVLSAGLLVFLASMAKGAQEEEPDAPLPEERRGAVAVLQLVLVAVSLVLLVLGSRWLVDGATGLARRVGLSELVIGLTLVAAGTSLPELATSVVAAMRNERDIAVGNIVGSNVFNLLAVLGLSAVVARTPLQVPQASLRLDFPFMIGSAGLCLVFFYTGRRLSKWEGLFFLAAYAAYLGILFQRGGAA